jgi:hypothetical protein
MDSYKAEVVFRNGDKLYCIQCTNTVKTIIRLINEIETDLDNQILSVLVLPKEESLC